MSRISDNILEIRKIIPSGVKCIAVSKTRSCDEILQAYEAGQRIFGENRAQEMAEKFSQLPADIEWHFIGHLQTNKVRFILPFVHMIHSIDSLRLLQEVNREARKNERRVDCLLQFYIAREESKFGLDIGEARALLESEEYQHMENIRICGVMGMASFIDDKEAVSMEFRTLRSIFDELRSSFFRECEYFRECSMGMSQDYPEAIKEGSTMVRLGTLIFGERYSR